MLLFIFHFGFLLYPGWFSYFLGGRGAHVKPCCGSRCQSCTKGYASGSVSLPHCSSPVPSSPSFPPLSTPVTSLFSLCFRYFLGTHEQITCISYIPFFITLLVKYCRYSFVLCFFHPTYPGNHSKSVKRDLSHSFFS